VRWEGLKVEVRIGTWEEFAEAESASKFVAKIAPKSLLITVSDMLGSYSDYEFYKEAEYEDLLRKLERTGNWNWIKLLKDFKFSLRCAEEPLGYFVFWRDKEVVDIIVVVVFLEELTANLVVYTLSDYTST
jgi:hypothetical protein